jgi:pimeloyl-ACP methyl ester carboxylesterase
MEALSPATYLRGIEELLSTDSQHLVQKITIPCLFLTGSEDQYAPPNSVKAFAESLGRHGAYTELPGCGHLPFLETPEEMGHEVKKFLSTIDS